MRNTKGFWTSARNLTAIASSQSRKTKIQNQGSTILIVLISQQIIYWDILLNIIFQVKFLSSAEVIHCEFRATWILVIWLSKGIRKWLQSLCIAKSGVVNFAIVWPEIQMGPSRHHRWYQPPECGPQLLLLSSQKFRRARRYNLHLHSTASYG